MAQAARRSYRAVGFRVQSGPSLKAATKAEEQGSEQYEHSLAPYHASPQVQPFQSERTS